MTEVVPMAGRVSRLQWAVASLPISGETVSGDMHIVCPYPGGILLGVVDALGHGPEAAFAAKVAVATLERYADSPIVPLFRRCHEMLAKTRGVVAALASLSLKESAMFWAGVGNVEGWIVRADRSRSPQSIIQFGGVVGYRLPKITGLERMPLSPGDRMIFTTDGMDTESTAALNMTEPLPKLAGSLLRRFVKGTDDALVLIAEYAGAPA